MRVSAAACVCPEMVKHISLLGVFRKLMDDCPHSHKNIAFIVCWAFTVRSLRPIACVFITQEMESEIFYTLLCLLIHSYVKSPLKNAVPKHIREIAFFESRF